MAFKQTEWKLSNETMDYPKPEAGFRYIKITDAAYDTETDPDNPKYTIKATDLGNNARLWLTYWPEGEGKGARAARGTLISLGVALAGVEIGVPFPEDIIGGVVTAEVSFNDKGYPRVYKYSSAPEDVVVDNADIDQYFEGSADTEVSH